VVLYCEVNFRINVRGGQRKEKKKPQVEILTKAFEPDWQPPPNLIGSANPY
jgi:hypothetical protein